MVRAALAAVALVTCTSAQAGNIVLVSSMTTAYTGTPGSVVRGTVDVRNTGSESETLSLSLNDFATRAPDTRDILDIGSLDRSMSEWLTLDENTLTVAPGQTRTIPYQINIPDDAGLEGSFWSILMLEEGSTPTVATTDGFSLVQRSRIASRILVTVPGGSRVVTFSASGLARHGEGVVFYCDVENTGTDALPLAPTVELYDDRGKKQGAYAGQTMMLYPGSSWRYTVDLTAAPPGDYTAILIADGGDDALFGARHPIHLD